MAVKFKPKPGKAHIKIICVDKRYYLWPTLKADLFEIVNAVSYCNRVNPVRYKTPGEAARALHYGSKK